MANGNLVPSSNSNSKRYRDLLRTLGRNSLHTLFPKDFEAYFVSLELTNSDGTTIDFLTFPIQPDQISETREDLVNIKKTAGGITSISSETFVPRKISISGSFGNRLKFIVSQQEVDATGVLFSTQSGVFDKLNAISSNGLGINFSNFSIQAKTGYGLIKIVEAILEKSNSLDENNGARRLFLYNPILGNNYLVKSNSFMHSQSMDTNTIPKYQIELTAIAPLEYVREQDLRSLTKTMTFDALNRGINAAANTVRDVI